MAFHCLMLLAWIGVNLLWWGWADRRVEPLLKRKALLRLPLAVFMGVQIIYLGWLLADTIDNHLPDPQPMLFSIAGYVWNILLLPGGLALMCGSWMLGRIFGSRARGVRGSKLPRPWGNAPSNQSASLLLSETARPRAAGALTRREALAAVVAAAPPLVSCFATARAAGQSGVFAVRNVDLPIPSLPRDLEGLTIAHVTDLHIGRFTSMDSAARAAEAVNALDCDLVAFTGDVIDTTCQNPVPGIDFLRRLHPRQGLAVIEGNHDTMHDAIRFEHEVKSAGLPLLLDESMTVRLPGRTPVQLLGITWGDLLPGSALHRTGADRNRLFREYTDEARNASVRRVAAQRDPAAFPILLAHHPHAFDLAADLGLPLTLSGHTHGGQIMLTPHIGVGPVRFRYWSGLYRRANSRLFISNGLGSWFPLRVNAPAELAKLTLRAAS